MEAQGAEDQPPQAAYREERVRARGCGACTGGETRGEVDGALGCVRCCGATVGGFWAGGCVGSGWVGSGAGWVGGSAGCVGAGCVGTWLGILRGACPSDPDWVRPARSSRRFGWNGTGAVVGGGGAVGAGAGALCSMPAWGAV